MIGKDLVLRHLRSASVLALALTATPALAATSAPANCHVEPFQLNFGVDVETRMTIKSGAVCGVSFTQSGLGRTVNAGGINHMAISEQPRHGRAGTSGFTSWGYASQKGYVGADRFVVEAGGEIMSNRVIRGTSQITVDVDVVP